MRPRRCGRRLARLWLVLALCAGAWVVSLGLIAPAQAAPYCLQVVGIPSQCLYADVVQCRRDAERQHGTCGLNAREVPLPKVPGARFCLVMNGPVLQCSYVDRRTCDAEASRRSAICADSARPGTPDVDLFRQ
jgi:hypothetical protein